MKHSILLAAIALLVMASCSQEEMSVRLNCTPKVRQKTFGVLL